MESSIDKIYPNRQGYKLNLSEFSCLCCGTCCRKYQPQINLDEASQIASSLNIDKKSFLREYTDPRWPGTQNFLLRHIKGACIFLQEKPETNQSLCRIHLFKPACCLNWKPELSKPECRQGLKNKFDLEVDLSGQIYGTSEKLTALKNYIQTLDDKGFMI